MISFKGCHFPKDVIMMCIRWYVAYPLSYRHVEELMEERGVYLDHATINRWVVKYSPALEVKFRKCKKPVGKSWRMDETYIKIKGEWLYYYRAVDKEGNTIDFFLSRTRDTQAAKAFFEKTIGSSGQPEKVNMDKSGANLAGLEEINKNLGEGQKILARQVKYLNNMIEQDHRGVKRITNPMLGFKSFVCATATLAGIELYRMIKKGQNFLEGTFSSWQQFYALSA
ncbi:IS6 family transposase [Candidatus Odyssella acanthamoebae]|uniref:Integrase n=1 Tax=Candidatus Odyssella acanthamoebae TaxID=91604 RepID=A0A077AY39_9PROT|nr:IS6 family transposase [Candidatus Paracaedibacter acanthamoebae]AIK95660.1 integrase [Candidatus Paracaedibacter acanthamoebae]